MVLTDSTTADAIFIKGHSKFVLDTMEELLKKGIKIRTTWISSEVNATDTPSRNVLNPRCRGGEMQKDEGCKSGRPRWEVCYTLDERCLGATLEAATETWR